MFLRVDILNLVPAVFSDIVAILTAPAVLRCEQFFGFNYAIFFNLLIKRENMEQKT
jgi:hypothetical protein